VARLRDRFAHVEFTHAMSDAEAAEAIGGADVALASRLSPAMIEQAPRLRWVHSTAAAVSGLLPLELLAARGIQVTNSRGVQASTIAEHVLGGILVISRRLNRILEAQRERRWIQNELTDAAWPWSLAGRQMTIIGFGTIGQDVARRAHAFGMRVTGVRRRLDQPQPPFVERILGPDRLGEALRGCNVLVIAAPSIPATDRLIGAEQIALLEPGAIIVNVARGRIVDEAAMIGALQDGRLGGAVLDVFDREPLSAESPLWTLPNVVISPHVSGVRPDHWAEVIDLFSENLRRFSNGEALMNLVNSRAGY
jgi:phosphoglycerate dehydrogenase-like enzyme